MRYRVEIDENANEVTIRTAQTGTPPLRMELPIGPATQRDRIEMIEYAERIAACLTEHDP
jgi:hypothetical protein